MTRTIEIPVSDEAARVLADDPSRAAMVGVLVEQILLHSPASRADRLCGLLDHTAARARDAGLTDAEIDEELAAYKSERRRRQ